MIRYTHSMSELQIPAYLIFLAWNALFTSLFNLAKSSLDVLRLSWLNSMHNI